MNYCSLVGALAIARSSTALSTIVVRMSALLPSFLRGQPNPPPPPSNNERTIGSGNEGGATNTSHRGGGGDTRRASAPTLGSTATASLLPPSVINTEQWNNRLASVNLTKEEINQLVMNYLVIEGYKDAAERFAQETGTPPPSHLGAIADRMMVRTAVHQGDLEGAIDLINDLQPDLLDSHPGLFFHLQQLRMRQIMMTTAASDGNGGRIEAAIEFAQEVLAPIAERHPEFLRELERTMALLVLGYNTAGEKMEIISSSAGDSTIPSIMASEEIARRTRLANEVNQALLAAESQECESRLPLLLRTLHSMQEKLATKTTFPKIIDYTSATLSEP